MAASQRAGLGSMDLEKELVCSICTELLYQPLTLLDCLHTFCGSCLKEWFSWQAARPRTSASSSQFTCPSCRAGVRESRPNATVTTLLEMFLKANPDRARSAEEKEEIARKYKPGDTVLPVEGPEANPGASDEEDQRLLEEVRTISLREVGIDSSNRLPSSPNDQSFRHRQTRNLDTSVRTEDEPVGRRHEEERRSRRQTQQQTGRTAANTGSAPPGSSISRRIEHQASLRSLLSSPDSGVTTIEEEILSQIVEEGLLDGIDLNSLDQAQEEELSERIAEAYRRRHQHRLHSERQRSDQVEHPPESNHQRSGSQTIQGLPAITSPADHPRQTTVSRSTRLGSSNIGVPPRGHRRRSSDQGTRRRGTSPTAIGGSPLADVTIRPAGRSSSDVANHHPYPNAGRPGMRESLPATVPGRTVESGRSITEAWLRNNRDTDTRQEPSSRQPLASPTSINSSNATSATQPNSPRINHGALPVPDASLLPEGGASAERNAPSRPSSSRTSMPRGSPPLYSEPAIACDRCGRADIQYDLHKNCSKCLDGKYNLCLRCYRSGGGCLWWSLLEPSRQPYPAQQFSQASGIVNSSEPRHILQSRKYRRPAATAHRTRNDGQEMTSDNPTGRLEVGMFCDICQSIANEFYYRCSQCSEGEWGFCHRCVNRGRGCNHPLLPIGRISSKQEPTRVSTGSEITASTTLVDYEPFHVTTKCDICACPIPPLAKRYHCSVCNDGDYDICTNCYLKLVASGKILKENGHNGWRRCLKGHRMSVVCFQNHEDGQRRVVDRDLVGGHTFKDDYPLTQGLSASAKSGSGLSSEHGSGVWSWKDGSERRKKASRMRGGNIFGSEAISLSSPTGSTPSTPSTRKFPPDGRIGLVVFALWSYYPDEDVTDELLFPRGAEITEVENINDEWYWGYYAGATGLFPGAYCRVISHVS